METTTILQCWVYRDSGNVSPVEIPKNETVGVLKKFIKDEKFDRFRDVEEDKLQLYSVCIPDDEKHLEDGLSQLSLEHKSPLDSRTKLSNLFPGSSEQWVIVIDGPRSGSGTTGSPVVIVPDMTLNCWMRSDTTGIPFTVDISSTNTVAALKKVIKNENAAALRDIDAHSLALYKVSIPYGEDDSVRGVLRTHTISGLGKPLSDSQMLSAVFLPPPANGQLHLIIDDLLCFQCWLRGGDPKESATVRTSLTANVNDLKSAIKAAFGKDLDDASPDRLDLYKISINEEDDLDRILGAFGSGLCLQANELPKNVFDDVPFFQTLCVVVEQREEKISKPPLVKDPIAKAREEFLKHYDAVLRPLFFGNPPASRPRQPDPQRRKPIPCGRPHKYPETIPETLLYPVFGQFIDDCQTVEVTADDNMFVERLADVMSAFYAKKTERVRKVDKEFQDYGIYLNARYLMGGDTISVNGHRFVIAEYRKSTELYLQAIAYYVESARESAPRSVRRSLPCLLLAIFGPFIVFSAATWDSSATFMAQPLSTPIVLHVHTTDGRYRLIAARHMVAFRRATQTLKQYYDDPKLQQEPPPGDPLPHEFPYPASYTSLVDGTLKTFEYEYQMDLGPDKLVFVGTEYEENGDLICIKFVQTYSCDAHQYLASLGCAPALRGFEKIPGGWSMVVMDFLSNKFEKLKARKKQLPSSVFADISAKLGLFHEAGFVHGDISDTNIMVSRTDETKFMIIDLDWAGRTANGEARYPARVNHADVERPFEVRDGKAILVEHDVAMLAQIIQLRSEH